ncbi:MAG TPA: immunoglobulin domain-containing protein [Candidatus Acidoferrum sp.]|nr:immunoglobulin domain-containing protein [Candidatus Acidoferrum sp.]
MNLTTCIRPRFTLAGIILAAAVQPVSAFVSVSVTPTNQAVMVGSNATFTALASTTGGESVTGYAWLVSTNGPFLPIANATNATLTVTNAQVTDAGSYFARVTYTSGTNTGLISASAAVTLVVYDQARIVTQPIGGLIRVTGSNVSFSVTAAGSAPLMYQWRFNRASLTNDARISGANGTNLTITALLTNDSGSYDVIVSNIYSSATSQVATLSVFQPPGISVPPLDTAVILGSNAVLSVVANGSTPIGYAWWKDGNPLSNGGRISGATNSTLNIAAVTTSDAGGYSVTLSNIVGAYTSSVAVLTVLVPPTITSPTTATGRQGAFFTYTTTATGTTPILFGVDNLPSGLTIEPTSGVIAGIPLVSGVFPLTLYATNAAMTTTGLLTLTLTTGVPGITSSLHVSGKEGQTFAYTITASNNPAQFTAGTLPTGLVFDPTSGTISGAPIVSGVFPIPISAGNQFGTDNETLTLTLGSALPVITSALTATWTENRPNFSYTIKASNSPTLFGASDLPLGLTFTPTNGVISGTPWEGGTYVIPIWAANAWGFTTTNLMLTVSNATLGGLAISSVIPAYSKPYVLDFSFSLMDPSSNSPVVRPPSQLSVVCMEDGVPISSEAPLILTSATGSKQLKTFLALDYTYSMYIVPGAIDAMQSAAELLINEEPDNALFGIIEFNADYMTPQFVTNSLTTTNNYFIANKTVLAQSIEGIQTNYVQGNYAGTRCWDAMYAALKQFGTNNPDEQRYLVAMTDGNDDSSLLNTNSDPMVAVDAIIQLAQKNHVAIYCVAFGNDVNTNSLEALASQTGGQYYLAATTSDLASQFQSIQKAISSQYVLRWATLKRAAVPAYPTNGFQPSFQITCDGFTASWNTDIVTTNIVTIDTNQTPPVTNSYSTNVVQFPFNPPDWSNDVRVGSLRLVTDADVGVQTIHLRATYVPRFVREIRLQYQPNFPCTANLDSTGTNEILFGWTMNETTDTNGLITLTMLSADTNNLLTSIPYAAFGDLVEFDFAYPEALTATQAFRVFNVDNSIYTNIQPSGISFTNQNFASFLVATNFPPPPPHGTPIPWLTYYGFTTNFAAAELIATNGLPVWQDYLAGLNPTNPASQFNVSLSLGPGPTPQITFSTVQGRTYRVETAITLNNWSVLRDYIQGTGGNIIFIDNRTLGEVPSVYYRVAVY